MVLILKLLYKEIRRADENFNRDARVAHLPLLGAPWSMLGVLLVYLLFIKVWGPKLMEKRAPFNLKLYMQIYNLTQVLLNIYVFYSSIRYSYMQPHFKFSCQEYDTQDIRESNMNLRYSAYIYYISKFLDLLDTIFFVLRKKYSQVTFLHVYHHTLMVNAVWIYCTLLFASHFTATGVINSFIHICMYTYYFVAALQPKMDLIPWKRRLTQLQILQFFCLTFHFSRPIFNNWCGLDMFWVWVAFLQNAFILVLFLEFYMRAYMKRSSKA